jgi:hypothetical protein
MGLNVSPSPVPMLKYYNFYKNPTNKWNPDGWRATLKISSVGNDFANS